MLELRVTGGFNGSMATVLYDTLGSLDGAAVKGALVSEGAPWPAAVDPVWKPCNVTGEGATRTVSQVVDSTQPVGHYHWWLWVQDGGLSTVVLVEDPDDSDRPWHILIR